MSAAEAQQNPGPSPATDEDLAAVHRQLGRPARNVVAVGARCPCGQPDVVQTFPRLDDGTPFPTMYYLTCPKAAGAIGTLEASGLMKEMTARIAEDPDLAAAQRRERRERQRGGDPAPPIRRH